MPAPRGVLGSDRAAPRRSYVGIPLGTYASGYGHPQAGGDYPLGHEYGPRRGGSDNIKSTLAHRISSRQQP